MQEPADHDFGQATSVDAEAIGQPGQRRFRLIAQSAGGHAAIWMEKQQLASIGEWLTEMVQRLDDEGPSAPDVEPLPPVDDFEVSFRADQIGLGFAEEERLFAILAHDSNSGSEAPTFRCLVSPGQARVLSRKIASVVAAGRRICPLCGQPMDPDGHVCPRSNGHHAGAVA
jgi:uncharacterized repeat protein (TIGR03847 family)